MAEDTKPNDAQAQELKKAPEAKPAEPKKEQKTIGEITDQQSKKERDSDSIPLSKFLEIKNENKELRNSLKNLESKLRDGASRGAVNEAIDDIKEAAEELDIDEKVLKRIIALAEKRAGKNSEELSEKLKNLESKDKDNQRQSLISKLIKDALDDYPQYKDVANPKILKHIFALPENSDKTALQVLEETYGNAIKGRKTIEGTSPQGGGNDDGTVDLAKAKTDIEYFRKVMANPKLKAQYNEQLISNASRRHK